MIDYLNFELQCMTLYVGARFTCVARQDQQVPSPLNFIYIFFVASRNLRLTIQIQFKIH